MADREGGKVAFGIAVGIHKVLLRIDIRLVVEESVQEASDLTREFKEVSRLVVGVAALAQEPSHAASILLAVVVFGHVGLQK